jgi:hypothetical protein
LWLAKWGQNGNDRKACGGFAARIKMAEVLRSDRLVFPNTSYLMILSLVMLTCLF